MSLSPTKPPPLLLDFMKGESLWGVAGHEQRCMHSADERLTCAGAGCAAWVSPARPCLRWDWVRVSNTRCAAVVSCTHHGSAGGGSQKLPGHCWSTARSAAVLWLISGQPSHRWGCSVLGMGLTAACCSLQQNQQALDRACLGLLRSAAAKFWAQGVCS